MNNQLSKRQLLLPVILGAVLAAGILLGSRLSKPPAGEHNSKISAVLNYIQQEYVDTVNNEQLVDISIEKILEHLDPHSAYIPASEVEAANEPLEGNFEGIGIEFHIQQDTIMVVAALAGGPSEALGIQSGDRIIKVDDKNVAGTGITNDKVFKLLKGKGGTIVKVSILRKGLQQLTNYNITRGKIPIYSIDAAYMVDNKTGYIKISRFAEPTVDEFTKSCTDLKKQGMANMILDLRGNPGGFLNAATELADEFLDDKKLIVFTKGKSRPKTSYFADKVGLFEKGKVVVLIDEGSASASEILSGALQDWDRATIIGRRSFGKGLVQEQTTFPDGSAMRLTIARYYTPTGRCIQKSYANGFDAYNDELMARYKHGEFVSADSVHVVDSISFTTPGGKKVYGGGGIMPDIFVPVDTTYDSDFLSAVLVAGLPNQFCYDYVDHNRSELKKYNSAKEFDSHCNSDLLLKDFVEFATSKNIKSDQASINRSSLAIKTQLKALIARMIWKNEGMYPILHQIDPAFKKAMQVINN